MDMVLEDWGRKAVSAALFVAIFTTILASALAAVGIPPADVVPVVFISFSKLNEMVRSLNQSQPGGITEYPKYYTTITTVVITASFQFIYSLAVGIVALAAATIYVVPPQFSFLVAPIIFVAALVQIAVDIYLLQRILDFVKSMIETLGQLIP